MLCCLCVAVSCVVFFGSLTLIIACCVLRCVACSRLFVVVWLCVVCLLLVVWRLVFGVRWVSFVVCCAL